MRFPVTAPLRGAESCYKIWDGTIGIFSHRATPWHGILLKINATGCEIAYFAITICAIDISAIANCAIAICAIVFLVYPPRSFTNPMLIYYLRGALIVNCLRGVALLKLV